MSLLINGLMAPDGATATWRRKLGYYTNTPSSQRATFNTLGNPTKTRGKYVQENFSFSGVHGLSQTYRTDPLYQQKQLDPYINSPFHNGNRGGMFNSNDKTMNPIAGTNDTLNNQLSAGGNPLNWSIAGSNDISQRLLDHRLPENNPLSAEYAMNFYQDTGDTSQLFTDPQGDDRFNDTYMDGDITAQARTGDKTAQKLYLDRKTLDGDFPEDPDLHARATAKKRTPEMQERMKKLENNLSSLTKEEKEELADLRENYLSPEEITTAQAEIRRRINHRPKDTDTTGDRDRAINYELEDTNTDFFPLSNLSSSYEPSSSYESSSFSFGSDLRPALLDMSNIPENERDGVMLLFQYADEEMMNMDLTSEKWKDNIEGLENNAIGIPDMNMTPKEAQQFSSVIRKIGDRVPEQVNTFYADMFRRHRDYQLKRKYHEDSQQRREEEQENNSSIPSIQNSFGNTSSSSTIPIRSVISSQRSSVLSPTEQTIRNAEVLPIPHPIQIPGQYSNEAEQQIHRINPLNTVAAASTFTAPVYEPYDEENGVSTYDSSSHSEDIVVPEQFRAMKQKRNGEETWEGKKHRTGKSGEEISNAINRRKRRERVNEAIYQKNLRIYEERNKGRGPFSYPLPEVPLPPHRKRKSEEEFSENSSKKSRSTTSSKRKIEEELFEGKKKVKLNEFGFPDYPKVPSFHRGRNPGDRPGPFSAPSTFHPGSKPGDRPGPFSTHYEPALVTSFQIPGGNSETVFDRRTNAYIEQLDSIQIPVTSDPEVIAEERNPVGEMVPVVALEGEVRRRGPIRTTPSETAIIPQQVRVTPGPLGREQNTPFQGKTNRKRGSRVHFFNRQSGSDHSGGSKTSRNSSIYSQEMIHSIDDLRNARLRKDAERKKSANETPEEKERSGEKKRTHRKK
jgi:hypothetical protein